MGPLNKISNLVFGLLMFSFMLTSSGCAFEDGPFSFRSASKRLENIWEYKKVCENGVDITFSKADQTVDFDSQGEVIIISSFTGTILQGTWDFNDHTDRIVLDLVETSSSAAISIQTEWIITRLSTDELNVTEYTDNKKFTYELVPKTD